MGYIRLLDDYVVFESDQIKVFLVNHKSVLYVFPVSLLAISHPHICKFFYCPLLGQPNNLNALYFCKFILITSTFNDHSCNHVAFELKLNQVKLFLSSVVKGLAIV